MFVKIVIICLIVMNINIIHSKSIYLLMIDNNDISSLGLPLTVSDVSNVDDSPLQSIELPFSFKFYDIPYRRIRISPNGDLHFDVNLPCCQFLSSCVFQYAGCNFDTSYYNLLAIYTMDFNPSSLTSAKIEYVSNSDTFDVYYKTLPAFVSSPTIYNGHLYTFRARIQQNGLIYYHYNSVLDPKLQNITKSYQLMIGLRDVKNFDIQTEHQNDYNTTISGAYVPRNLVKNDRTIIFCPLVLDLCVSPRLIPQNGNVNIYISTSNPLCFQQFSDSFYCSFGHNKNVTATYNSTYHALICKVPSSSNIGKVHVDLLYVPNNTVVQEELNRNISIYMNERVWIEYVNNDDIRLLSGSTIDQQICIDCANTTKLTYCTLDCANEWLGNATFDNCQICSGGKSGHIANSDIDCNGNCFGDAILSNDICVCTTCPKAVVLEELSTVNASSIFQLILTCILALFLIFVFSNFYNHKVFHYNEYGAFSTQDNDGVIVYNSNNNENVELMMIDDLYS